MNQKKNLLRAIAGALVLTLSLSCFAVPTMAAETEGTVQAVALSEGSAETSAEETQTEETTAVEIGEETSAETQEPEESSAEESAAAETSAEESAAAETTVEEIAVEETSAEESAAAETAVEESESPAETVSEETVPEESVSDDVEAVKDNPGTEMAAPKNIRVLPNNSYGLVVTWDAVPGASSYIVYKHNGSQWVEAAKPTEVSYTDALDAEVGTTCKYAVAAVGTVGGVTKTSSYDAAGVTGTVCPPQPKMKDSLSRGQTKLEIRWEESEGANFYCVYRKDDSGKWTRLSGSLTTNSFLDTSVVYGKEYTYAVICGVKKTNATYWSFTTGGKVDLDAPGVQTITAKTVARTQVVVGQPKLVGAKGVALKSITVNWEAVDGADGYIVYRSTTGKAGTWKRRKKIKSATTLTYTDKKCTFNKKYYFTVRAYINYDGKEKAGSWDTKGVSAKSALAIPEKQVAQGAGLKSIKVSWNKVSGASGYYIYRKAKASAKWKKIGSTGAKTLTYTDKKLAGKESYLYTVRAWRKSGKKKIKGLYDKKGVKGAIAVKKKMKNGLQLYYNEKGNLITDVEDIIGKRSSYRLEVDWDDNIVTVYAKGDNGTYNLPVKAFCCSTGEATPIGTFHTPAKYRWHELNGQLYGQWCTRIHGGVLFHSVYYYSYNNANDLSTSAYNKLGTKCSHGCVRLCCRDAKWIYDNCSLGTTVVIKRDCKNPFGKPSSYKISSSHTWDPTDPNMYYKCRNAGCH